MDSFKKQMCQNSCKLIFQTLPHPPGQIETEHREETDREKDEKMLRGDLQKLNTLLSKNGQLSVELEQENTLMETDMLHRLKALQNITFVITITTAIYLFKNIENDFECDVMFEGGRARLHRDADET